MKPQINSLADQPTRLIRSKRKTLGRFDARRPCEFPERLALFAVALCGEAALDFLEGLSEPNRSRARAHAQRAVSWDSASRQAKMAREFGTCADADKRLMALMAEAGLTMRSEIFRLLPPFHRSLFPTFKLPRTDDVVSPGLIVLAKRLVREATR